MSKDLLIELKKECIELGMAGSELGIGNNKLEKLLPKFEKLGQKIRPFKMVKDRINTLINSKKDESEDNLISLLNLVDAILLTQAETDIDGEIEILQGNSGEMSTNISNNLIAPVVTALTTKGGGRYNEIAKGFREGICSDFRLIPLLIRGLDDKYGEIGELIYEKLSEHNNPEYLPLLKESFNKMGKKNDLRKLNLMGQILEEDEREFVINLLEDSSKEIKIEAVNILGNMKDTEDILLEQAKSKIKDIREAAYLGLVKINSEEGRKELKKAIKKADYDIVLAAIRDCESENYADVLLTRLNHLYGKFIKKQNVEHIEDIMIILDDIRNHKSEDVFEFLVKCLEEGTLYNWKTKEYDYQFYGSRERVLIECIGEYDHIPEKVRDLIQSRREMNNNKIFDLEFYISLKSRTYEEVYEIYSPYFINKTIKQDTAYRTISAFLQYLGYKRSWYTRISHTYIDKMLVPVYKEFDKRWNEIFRLYEAYDILAYTLNKEDKVSIEFLLKKLKTPMKIANREDNDFYKDQIECMLSIIGLLKIGHEGVYELILNKIKEIIDNNGLPDNFILFIPYFPSEYIKETEEYLMKLKRKNEEVENRFLDMSVKKLEEVLSK
ncbi:HEAT repeat domain-containing protein [Tepidibacter hydrothermalis]|uniref:HEAT repeat domain-containing protein n=1 Tax=Tepidibacter hydrothermalis TaxID=3036126 RepID=A0ABY8E9Z6_9FIRM|nr:HEAT repeat domain-containing protein [Tepidibacter hydrothermalis]WFD09725.1 HEAT repeat domain-containing protein [Tepidibacter hydrothermalis]